MATIISNQANATYTFDGSNEMHTTTSNIANTTLLDDFSLEVNEITYQNTFAPGENITYTLLVKNTGTKEIKDFNVNVNLNSFLSYKQNSAKLFYNGNISSLEPSETSPLTFNVTNTLLPSSHMFITYIAVVNKTIDDNLMDLSNQTSISISSMENSKQPAININNPGLITRELTANLNINKEVSKNTIQSIDTYDYTLTIENTGLIEAKNVTITDNLPNGFTVTSITIESGGQTTTLTKNDYVIDEENTLVIPSTNGVTLNIPSSNKTSPSKTIIKISGIYNSQNI